MINLDHISEAEQHGLAIHLTDWWPKLNNRKDPESDNSFYMLLGASAATHMSNKPLYEEIELLIDMHMGHMPL